MVITTIIETVLLSTHNICFGREIRELDFWYTLLTKDLNGACGFVNDVNIWSS